MKLTYDIVHYLDNNILLIINLIRPHIDRIALKLRQKHNSLRSLPDTILTVRDFSVIV